MIDVEHVAALLHVEEKLRAHGSKYTNMLNAVNAKLAEFEAAHTPKPEPQPEPVKEPEVKEPANGNGDRRV